MPQTTEFPCPLFPERVFSVNVACSYLFRCSDYQLVGSRHLTVHFSPIIGRDVGCYYLTTSRPLPGRISTDRNPSASFPDLIMRGHPETGPGYPLQVLARRCGLSATIPCPVRNFPCSFPVHAASTGSPFTPCVPLRSPGKSFRRFAPYARRGTHRVWAYRPFS